MDNFKRLRIALTGFVFLFYSFAHAGQTVNGDFQVNGKISAVSTTKGSKPCPEMTATQRDAIVSPSNGDCVFNTTDSVINIYSSTDLAWNEISGTGGGDPGILTNGGFEKGIANWTLASGTASFDTSVKIEGKQALSVALTAQTLSLKQSSTLNASAISGLQGLAYAYALAPVGATLKLCAIQAGVTSTTLCHSLPGTGAYRLYKIPFTLSATSSGVELLSTAAITGTVKVDKVWVGAVDLKQEGDSSRIAGESYFAGTTSCVWARTSTTIGAFTATSACPGPTVTMSTLGDWQTTDSDLPRQTINNLPAGKYKVTFIVPAYMTVAANSSIAITDGTTTCEPTHGASGTNLVSVPVSCVFTYSSSGNRSFELYAASPSSTLNIYNAQTSPRISTRFILEYFSSSSTYSSTNADTDWAAYSPTLTTSSGSITNASATAQYRRQGGNLIVSGSINFTGASAVFNRPRISIPPGLSIDTARISGLSNLGDVISLDTGIAIYQKGYVEYLNSTTLNIIGNGVSGSNLIASDITNASPFTFNAGDSIQFNFSVPIQGWENSNVIIGQFNGLESCTDSYQCTDTYSAKVSSAGNVSDENLEWITGNASLASTSVYTMTFKTGLFTVAPNCTVALKATGTAAAGRIDSISSTTLVFNTYNNSFANVASDFHVSCQKQGADYIGKTAKAVASDQNVRAIGSVGADIQAVHFGSGTNCMSACSASPCTVCTRVGSKITSVARTGTGVYDITGIDGTKYICTGGANSGSAFLTSMQRLDQSTSTTARMTFGSGGTGIDGSSVSVTCMGVP